MLVLVTSDHGNLEDSRGGHTRNEVPLIAIGPGHTDATSAVRALTDVSPFILRLLRPATGLEGVEISEGRGAT